MFRDIAAVVDDLAAAIASRTSDGPTAVVTHSFGDWLTRSALERLHASAEEKGTPPPRLSHLLSIAPVTTAVPGAERLAALPRPVPIVLPPELHIMADHKRSEVPLDAACCDRWTIFWPRGELIVRRFVPQTEVPVEVVTVLGTHNSLPWQPGLHRAIAQRLSDAAPLTKSTP